MDIAVIGAAGSVGRAVCEQILTLQILEADDRLQLVGRRGGSSEAGVFGLRIDLLDAFAIRAPVVEPVVDAQDISADVIVMVAGATPAAVAGSTATRDDIAAENLPIFEHYASAIARHGRGHELVIIQSNPVELAVEVFSRHLGRHRVVGAGAYNDTVRFRREIGKAFRRGFRRPLVTGFMLGEHGPNVVPIWSSVSVHGVPDSEVQAYIRSVRAGRDFSELPGEVADARNELGELLSQDRPEDASNFVHDLPPDVRSLVKPWFAHWTRRTSTVTAHSAVDLVSELVAGHRLVLPLQVSVKESEWPGVDSVIGLPVDIDITGWHHVIPLELQDDEQAALLSAAHSIRDRITAWQP